LDEHLAQIVNKMLEKNVLQRYQKGKQVIADLEQVLSGMVDK
jgi:hypothetical protein